MIGGSSCRFFNYGLPVPAVPTGLVSESETNPLNPPFAKGVVFVPLLERADREILRRC